MSDIKFGTDGWRALMSDSFNTENVKKIAQAIADYLNEDAVGTVPTQLAGGQSPKVFIGYDTRQNSDTFAKACADVLAANNIKVFLPERAIPTPITAFAIKDMSLSGAIMITASHNPPQYNGIKFIPFYAGPATEDITKAIEKNLNVTRDPYVGLRPPRDDKNVLTKEDKYSVIPSERSDEESPVTSTIDPIPAYKKHLEDLIDTGLLRESKLKVLASPMFGAAHGIFSDILKDYGCEVEAIDDEADPNFGGLTPEPIPKNLGSTIQKLKSNSYDIALVLDGDADRFGVFDSNALFIQANHVLALIADYLVSIRKLKGSLVRSVATTHFLDVIAQSNGLKAHETPVGFKYVGQIMREEPVVLGGEESAGLSVLNHIPEKDGILAGLLLAEITAYYGKPLGEVLEELFKKYQRRFITRRLDLELSMDAKEALMRKLKTEPAGEIAGLKVTETIDIDGVKFILEEGSWLLARPSGTEPIVRIYLEADSPSKLDKLEKYATALLDATE